VLGVITIAAGMLICVASSIRRRRKQRTLVIAPCMELEQAETSREQSFFSNDISAAPAPGGSPVVRLTVAPDRPSWRASWDCLAFNPRTSVGLRWALPIVITANIAFFVSSNSGDGTNIRFGLKANGKEVVVLPPLKQYTLVGSVKDMADSGVFPLAALIVIFSGTWPYIKLLMMMLCWFAPTRILSVKRRQMVLSFLDAYGKWSLVDMFVMVIMMVAFKFDCAGSAMPLPLVSDILNSVGAGFEVHVFAEPEIGFHIFILATLMSLILGHMMSGCHRWAHQLCEYGVARDGTGGVSRICDKIHPQGLHSRVHRWAPAVTLSVSGLLVLLGVLLDTFNFTFQGLAGFLLGEDSRIRPFSVATLSMAIPAATQEPNSPSTRFIQGTFIMFTMVLALAYPVLLTVLWSAPLTEKVQRRLLVSCQVIHAWNALDVFVVSILAGVLEIERFALAIIGDKCDPINHLLERSPWFVQRIPGNPVCFDVMTVLRSGFWLLAVAALIEYIAGNVVLFRCSKAFCSSPEGGTSPTNPASPRPSTASTEVPATEGSRRSSAVSRAEPA